MRSIHLAVLLVAALAASACGVPQEKYDADTQALKAEIAKARGENADLQVKLAEMTKARAALEAEIAKLNDALRTLTGERDALAKAEANAQKRIDTFKNMLAKFQKMIASGKIKIRIANNKMIVEMASAILFPSGSATLSDEGKEALTEVAGILATIGDRAFQVAGHTDNIPIKRGRFKSNWDLSSARAVSVVQHLIGSGMDSVNLSAAGYAETQPVASNDEEDGRAQNRRIEIVLQPSLDELPNLSALESMLDG
jgi:chemotaxis protein MotB